MKVSAKVLVTGCAGFIGSNFLKWVIEAEPTAHFIHLDALTYAGNLESIKELVDHPRHEFVRGSINDATCVDKLVSRVDMVINFAAESHVDRSIDGPEAFIRTNVFGTFTLLEAARKQKRPIRFVQVSTDEVYGSLGDIGQFVEETALAPNSPYSASKASADLLVRAYHHTYGLDTIITRCSNNYGPYQFPEKLIPLMIQNALHDRSLPVYGDGLNVRDWIHVLDHARGVWMAARLGRSGEVYNFGADNEWPNIKIVRKILELTGKPESLIKYVQDRPGHDRRYAMGAAKARRELGWKPEIKFDEGLRSTLEWYKSNTEWVTSVMSGDYKSFFDRWYQNR